MSAVLGTGEHRYRVVDDWAKLPDGWEMKDVAAVAVDSRNRVYVFNRGEHPMIVFDADGNFIKSWGEGTFPRAHGLHIDAQDNLYFYASTGMDNADKILVRPVRERRSCRLPIGGRWWRSSGTPSPTSRRISPR